MASARCLVNGAVLGISSSFRADRIVVTVSGDGVAVYDLNTNTPRQSWALGQGQIDFAAPAVLHKASRHLFAVVHPLHDDSNSTLLAWPIREEASTIPKLATHIILPSPVSTVLPLPAKAAPSDRTPPSPADDAPAVFVAHANGSISLCSPHRLLSENTNATGMPLIAAALQGSTLHTIHGVRGAASVLLGQFAVVDGHIVCEALQQADAADPSLAPVTATFTAGKAVVLWSDGCIAAYAAGTAVLTPPRGIVTASFSRRLIGFDFTSASAQAHAHAAAAGSKTPGPRRKKRGLSEAVSASSSKRAAVCVGGVDGDGLVVVAGWSEDGSALRVVGMDVAYGAVQCVADVAPSDAGVPRFDTSGSLQVLSCPGSSSQAILSAGGAVLIMDMPLKRPTLAALIGALSIPASSSNHPHKHQLATSEMDSSNPPPPCYAAAAALHPDDVAELMRPRGAAASAVRYGLKAIAATSEADHSNLSSAGLLTPVTAAIQHSDGAESDLRDAESDAWKVLREVVPTEQPQSAQQSKSGNKKHRIVPQDGICEAIRRVLSVASKGKRPISYDLLCEMLVKASEAQLWEVIEDILAVQRPISLAGCPTVATRLANAGRYDAFAALLDQATDLAAADIANVLQCLISAPSTDVIRASRRNYASQARKVAEAAVVAAERAAPGSRDARGLTAAAERAAGSIEGFSPSHVCLHPLLMVKNDAATLLEAFKRLSSHCIVPLLEYLLRWLKNHNTIILGGCVESPSPRGGLVDINGGVLAAVSVPEVQTVIQWLNLSIDACMTRMLFKRQAVDVLDNVRNQVVPWISVVRRLGRVKGAVEHLRCGAPLPLPSSGAAGRYSLEWLSLRVAR